MAESAGTPGGGEATAPGVQGREFQPLTRGLFLGLVLGLGMVLATLGAVWALLDRSHLEIARRIGAILRVEEPTSAAAYEMEINVVGAGLGVLKYVSTGDPQHRERVSKDESDFARVKAEYDRLTSTPAEYELGARIAALHREYARVGHALMDLRDRRAALREAIADGLAEADYILDHRIESGIGSGTALAEAQAREALRAEGGIAEVGMWLGNYIGTGDDAHRERLLESLRDVHAHFAVLEALRLAPRETVARLGVILGRIETGIHSVLAVHRAMREHEAEFIRLRDALDGVLDEDIQTLTRSDLAAAGALAQRNVGRLRELSALLLGLTAGVCVAAALLLARRSRQLRAAGDALGSEIVQRRKSEAVRSALLERLTSAQEDERGHLARELHDRMAQQLSALTLGLEALRRGANAGTPVGGDELRKLKSVTDALVEEVHSVAWELRPAALDEVGLPGALAKLADDWAARAGVPIDLHCDLARGLLPSHVETTLYRLAQEALTNAFKHARARSVSVLLTSLPDHARLVVEDDGRGFDPDAILDPTRGGPLGLVGMRERVALAGGTLEIDSAPGKGTTLVVRIPTTPTGDRVAAA